MPESKQDRLQLEQFLPYVLNRLADRVSEDMSALYTRDYGLTVPEWRIVANLAEHQTLNARTIVSLTGMEKTKVSRAVSALDQRGLIAHYEEAAKCGLPIIIYNIPGRSVVDMAPATMGELAKLPMIVGVKDATGDLSRVPKQRITCGKDFIQLSGEDATALGFNAHGGVGCISVTANVAPKLCAEFQEATLAGDYKTALEYQDRLMPLHEAIFLEPGVAGAKFGLSLLGMCSDEVRSPLTTLTAETKERIRAAMVHAGLIN